MKTIILFVACLFLSACGSSSNTPPATSQPIDYFNKPHSVAMVVADQAINTQASNLIISGVSRTVDTVTLDFSMTVVNTGAISQNVDIIISGKDRYNLEVMAPVISVSALPGETRVINQQKQFAAGTLYQVETWTVQSVGPTALPPAVPVEPMPAVEVPPVTPDLPVIPIAVAGAAQTVNVWETVSLSGAGSSDPNKYLIGYTWSFITKPAGSNAVILNSKTETPSFTPDYVGDYVLKLVVTNGKAVSFPTEVIISALPFAATEISSDSTGTISVSSATFDYWYETGSKTNILVKFSFITNDGLLHSFRAGFSAVDSFGNIVYSGTVEGGAPNLFQTSANIDTIKYSRISKWLVTDITKY